MNWDQLLSRPVGTKSAKLGRELYTLGEALDMIDEDLPEFLRRRSHWQEARHRLIKAAESGKREDIQEATVQVLMALSADGNLASSSGV